MRHLRWVIVPVVVLPLGWLLFQGFGIDPRAISSPLIGRPAPAWALEALDGRTMSSDELEGRPYVVNFWASWCGPCVDEHPVLAAAHAEHGDRLTIVGVVYNDSVENARGFLDRYGDAGYRNVLDPEFIVAVDYGVVGPPETYFVDGDGVVRAKQVGPLTDEAMAEKLSTIGIGS